MQIKTTIHLQGKALEHLCDAAEKTGCSKSHLIVLLMERTIPGSEALVRSFSRIEYQGRDPEGDWKRLHIRLREDEYEYALDLRKFYKKSFSGIIARAIEKYLDEIITRLLNPAKADGGDNYRVKNYIFIREDLDGVLSWRICWGIPRNLSDIVPFETE